MRFAVALWALMVGCSAGAAASAPEPSSSLERLLARVRAASGAPYTAHLVGELRRQDADGPYTVKMETEGDRSLVQRCRNGVCEGAYFDGSRAFAVNLNGTALPSTLHPNDDERVMRAIASQEFASPQFRDAGGFVALAPSVVRNGVTYRRVTVQSGNADFSVLIDPRTWTPVEATTADGAEAAEFRDFRRVGRFLLPFEVRRGGAVERYETRRVVAGALSAPVGMMPAFTSAAHTVRMVPAGPGRAEQPVVPCTVGGVTVNCLVDTGNSSLGMSLELAERLGLEARGAYEIGGIGRYVTAIVTAGPLVVGPATFGAAHYVVLHDVHDYGYDVVLGADVLAHTRTTIDYAARAVSLTSAADTDPPATIPLRFDGMMPVVGVQLGAIDVPLALDTGDEATINVPYTYYEQNPALFEVRARRKVAGIGGTAEQVIGQIASVRLSTFEVRGQAIAATQAAEPAASGHLGGGFLSHFRVTLDYPHARLGLTPRPNDAAVQSE